MNLLFVVFLAATPLSEATCATFAAWLSANKQVGHMVSNAHLTKGFVAITVAPDLESVDVNWQVTADAGATFSGANYITSVGIYGPATVDQVKPASRGVLLDLQTLPVMAGQTSSVRLRLTSPEMSMILQLMREGHAYVNVATGENPDGELRGQIVVPHCLEAEMMGTEPTRGFANVLLSGMEYAVLAQASPDASALNSGMIEFATGEPPISLEAISNEWSPLAPNMGQVYSVWLSIDPAHQAAFMSVASGMATATVSAMSGGMAAVSGALMEARSCRQLMTAEDSLFSIARSHRSDWLTVWSMNLGQPDRRRTLEPKYFAHPMQVSLGDSGDAIARRFGMTMKELQMVNPAVMDLASLSVGSTICVLPNWQQTVSGNGRKICMM